MWYVFRFKFQHLVVRQDWDKIRSNGKHLSIMLINKLIIMTMMQQYR